MGFKSINSVGFSPQCDSHCCPSCTRSVIRHFREGGGKQTNKQKTVYKSHRSASCLQLLWHIHRDDKRVGPIYFSLFSVNRPICLWENEGKGGGGERREMVLFCAYDEILSHRKWHGLTSFHSCVMVSKNLICKLLKARQKALVFCTKLSFSTSEKTTCN